MKTLKLIKYDELQLHEIRESDIAEDVENIIERMTVRGQGNFKNNAIYLPYAYDYVLGKDNEGTTILVPLKKKNDCCK